jgi:hypothetical protein
VRLGSTWNCSGFGINGVDSSSSGTRELVDLYIHKAKFHHNKHEVLSN